MGKKKGVSKYDQRYQRLDGDAGISFQRQQVSEVVIHMIALAEAPTNHRAATSNCTDHAYRSSWEHSRTGLWC